MFIDSLDYNKYHISIYEDVDYKNAYYCQVYLAEDTNHDNCIDDFCIFEEQMKDKTLKEAIIYRMQMFMEWVESEVKQMNIKDIIETYLNNTEEELYCKLSDEQVEKVAKNIENEVLGDKELIKIFYETIDYYAKWYIVTKLGILYDDKE